MNNKYHVELTESELNKFNFLSDDYQILKSTKIKMMAIYSYLLLKEDITKDGFKSSQANIWELFSKKKARKDIVGSYSNFRKLMYKLINHGFLFVERLGKVNIYYARKNFLNDGVANGVTNGVTNENPTETIDITSVEVIEPSQQILNSKRDILDIDIYNHSDRVVTDNKKSFKVSKVIEKCKSVIEARRVAKEMLEHRKIINQWVYNRVMVIISYKYKDVSIGGLKGYITTLIDQAIYLSQQNYKINTYYNNKALNKTRNNANSSTSFANFTQREYDYDALEKQLLGWE